MDNNPKKDIEYDPRIAYEWVPATLVLVLMFGKVVAYLSPYFAALVLENENVGLVSSIASDDTYNMLLATMVGFWIRDKIGKKPGE